MRQSRYNIWTHLDATHCVYNAASGALLRVSPEDHAALERFLAGEGGAPCALPLLLALAKKGMLVADELDEVDALRRLYEKARQERGHLGLTLVTSLGCNFACPYCYEAKRPLLMDGEVQRSVLRYVDDRLPELASLDVTWYGGEPLLGRRALFALSAAFIERCAAAGVRYDAGIVTNGYLLDAVTCRRLRDHGVTYAQITLDGPPEVHDRMRPRVGGQGTFWQIVKNLGHAVNYFSVAVRVNLDGGNYDQAADLFTILAGEGLAGKVTVYPGHLRRWDDHKSTVLGGCGEHCLDGPEFAGVKHHFTELAARSGLAAWAAPQLAGLHCGSLNEGNLVVGAGGELYRCLGSIGDPNAVIGDIRTYGAADPGPDPFSSYEPFADAECRACIALPVCMGGCPLDAVASDRAVRRNRCHDFRYTYAEHLQHCAQAVGANSGSAAPPA